MAAAGQEMDLEVAAILCGLRGILRARDRRRRRRQLRLRRNEAAPEIPSWGQRRLRSVLGDSKPLVGAAAAERDGGAASPDTPLAFFPESGGDDAPEGAEHANKATAQAEWAQEQRGVVASLSHEKEKTHLLKEIDEYTARLQSSRSAKESLKQLHQVRQSREQQEPARMTVAADPRHPAALALRLGLDLNEPAPPAPEDEAAAARAAAEWYRRGQLQQRAAVAASARRRRLEYLRAKVASPLVSCRTRRVAG